MACALEASRASAGHDCQPLKSHALMGLSQSQGGEKGPANFGLFAEGFKIYKSIVLTILSS